MQAANVPKEGEGIVDVEKVCDERVSWSLGFGSFEGRFKKS